MTVNKRDRSQSNNLLLIQFLGECIHPNGEESLTAASIQENITQEQKKKKNMTVDPPASLQASKTRLKP